MDPKTAEPPTTKLKTFLILQDGKNFVNQERENIIDFLFKNIVLRKNICL